MTTFLKLWTGTRWYSIIARTLTAMALFISCEDTLRENEPVVEETPIKHVVFDAPKVVSYNHPVSLDLNEDGINDFAFTVGLFMDGQNVDQYFVAVSLLDSRIKLNDLGAAPYGQDVAIGDVSVPDIAEWSIDAGELMTGKLKPDGSEVWSGPWITHPESFLGIAIRVNGKNYYGWVKLLSKKEEKSIHIVEYAIQTNAGKPINTGQTELSFAQ